MRIRITKDVSNEMGLIPGNEFDVVSTMRHGYKVVYAVYEKVAHYILVSFAWCEVIDE